MSKADCYDLMDHAGNIAGVSAFGGLTAGTEGMGTIPAAFIGEAVNYDVDHLGQWACDAVYDHPHSEILDVGYDANTHIAEYAFGNENSSVVQFEYADLTCQPLDEGLCVMPDIPDAIDSGGMGD